MKKTIKKNFKKLFAMVTASVLAVFVMSFASCAQSADDSKDDKVETPAKKDAEDAGEDDAENKGEEPVSDPVIAEVIKMLSIPETLENNMPLKLPNKITVDSTTVTIAWSSSDPAIIDNNGSVTPKAGKDEDTVTLTAVFMYDDVTVTKKYTVKVFQTYKIYAATALKNINIEYEATYAYEVIKVPYYDKIDDKTNVEFTYTSSDERSVKPYTSNDYLKITKDLTAKTVTVTVEADCNGAKASKDFTIEVPAVTSFRENYFKDNEYTISNGYSEIIFDMGNKEFTSIDYETDGSKDGKKYSFEFGDEPGQLIVTTIAMMGGNLVVLGADPDKWYTRDDLAELLGGMLYQFDALAKNPPKSYSDLEDELEKLGMGPDGIAYIMSGIGGEATDTEEVQKANMSAFLSAYLQSMLESNGVQSLEEYIEVGLKQFLATEPDGDVCGYSVNQADYYTAKGQKKYPSGGYIDIRTLYNSKENWFNQCGSFCYYEYETIQGSDTQAYDYRLRCREDMEVEIRWHSVEVEGSFNSNYTEFNAENGDKYTITDKKDGTVTVSNGSKTLTLEFDGKIL